MRQLLRSLILLLSGLGVSTSADEPDTNRPASGIEQAVATTEAASAKTSPIELTSGTNLQAAGWRPGLLGQRYVEARYHHFVIDSSFLELFDDSEQGGDVTLNWPLLSIGERSRVVGIDAFVNHRSLRLSGERYFGPPDDMRVAIASSSNVTQLATSLYVEHDRLGPVRPFVQLGLQYAMLKSRTEINGSVGKWDDDGFVLLLAPGVEADIAERIALRGTFDLIPVVEDGSARFLGDVIVWPWDRVFLRGGVEVPFDDYGTGGSVGAGVAF